MEFQLNMTWVLIGCGVWTAVLGAWALTASRAKSRLEKQLAAAQPEISLLREAREKLEDELQETEDALNVAEQNTARMAQQIESFAEQKQQFEDYKKQMLDSSKASVMDAGTALTKQLLQQFEERQQSSQKSQQQSEQRVLEQFTKASNMLSAMQQKVNDNSRDMTTVMRSLTHPGGAGAMAEIGLENTLKNMGLERDRDFFMQYHTGDKLRPDAILMLPQDMVIVVDSKSSKHLIELAEVEGTDEEEKALKQLATSMQKHLRDLTKKDYADSVRKELKERGKSVSKLCNVMYLPSDAAVEKLHKADPSFLPTAEKNGIMVVGYSGLRGLVSLSVQEIASARQQENMHLIMGEVGKLIDGMGTALGHVSSVGKAIKATAERFDSFARSLNASVLPKMRKASAMGVEHRKALPQPIATYEVRSTEDLVQVEAEAEDATASLADYRQQKESA